MLRVESLSCRYGRIEALNEVTCAAAAGRITIVLGPNASGKSTLLRAMIGAMKPASGSVTIGGRAVHRMRPGALARRVAYVAQRPTVAASFTVHEVIELGRFALPPDRQRVDEALTALDLDDVAGRPFDQLSGGQQQRVAIARAVAQLAPEGVLVLDEPTSAMDLAHVAVAVDLLRRLADGGATVVMAMHDLPLAAAIADDAWLLRAGRLAAAGPAASVLTAGTLQEIFGVAFHRVDHAPFGGLLAPELLLTRSNGGGHTMPCTGEGDRDE